MPNSSDRATFDQETDSVLSESEDDENVPQRLWQIARSYVGRSQDRTSPVRLASHGAVLLVALIVLALSQVKLPSWEIQRAEPEPVAQTVTDTSEDFEARGGNNLFGRDTLIRNAVPLTEIPDRPRLDVITYTVQLGDTVYDLAQRFKVTPETIMWANGRLEDNPDLLRLGQPLAILPVSGVYHKVAKGDTIASLAKKYKVPASTIVSYAWNQLTDVNQPLAIGRMVIVPGGEKPYVAKNVAAYSVKAPAGARKGTGALAWPSRGKLTQKYWSRHPGIDIAARKGTAVWAADSGFVVAAGWSPVGYGYHIVVDHGNGIQTLYAHLSRFAVRAGDTVSRGQVIGYVGSTGNSTGPHLHFEVRVRGAHRNPLGMLP
jgi:murein DD-endopeptidase MepM/ murein hydrolase activator NlpD